MASRIKLIAIVLILTLVGGGLAAYKHTQLGIPLKVGEEPAEWLVEAKVSFIATEEAVTARLSLPASAIEEKTGVDSRSTGYSFMIEDQLGEYTAVWSADKREGNEALYYRVRFPERGIVSGGPISPSGKPPEPDDPGMARSIRVAAESIVRRTKELSSNPDTLVAGIFRELNNDEPSQETSLLKDHYEELVGDRAKITLAIDLLKMSGVAARLAYGVQLDEIRGAQEPIRLLEYYDGVYWQVRDPEAPTSVLDPRQMFVWNRGGDPLLDLSGGENSQVVFTATRDMVPMDQLTDLRSSGLLVSTIFGLPASERQVFRYVVLIPIGAFVVVLLRNLIGIATLGTFMPVLLAMALLEMELKSGLLMFAIIVGAGLWCRFLLSRLNLLVVPRVAACVVIVTLLMMLLSVVSWHLGMRDGLKITLFPMIILAWTIERMSLTWEEEGKRSAILQVLGSLIVAVVAFTVMEQRQVRYLAFYFPELLLVLLAGILLLGRYTGYRLSELIRFKNFEPVD
ncbi:UUP1 family membrane protein [Haloferula rosea]|uniref:UUP1 family membrane protein n=1 Tax=Haloferula rosea TaxID=490093 RepID=A0A934RCX1_9BACT|nr:UUP1 family membrane protein [Haloferula rosea]MBK1827413.1 UUP1 family membrane protein [Haloferula rosea]